ncbi:GbsR/MarR family transcriptional regulator [soil metagenome]
MKVTALMEEYILHWGRMGTRWGVNRTVSQIYALLYLAPNPLPADEISRILGVARSNVSNSLRELQSWGLVSTTHRLGDRRDLYTTCGDAWDMLMTIMEKRKRREVEPTLAMLRRCANAMDNDDETPAEVKRRVHTMLGVVSTAAEWFDQVKALPRPTLVALMKMGTAVRRLVPARRTREKASA